MPVTTVQGQKKAAKGKQPKKKRLSDAEFQAKAEKAYKKQAIQEDDPRWNWRTMGNRRRGGAPGTGTKPQYADVAAWRQHVREYRSGKTKVKPGPRPDVKRKKPVKREGPAARLRKKMRQPRRAKRR